MRKRSPKPRGKTKEGVQTYGPAGGGIWAADGNVVYGPVDVAVSGASPQTVGTSNTTKITATGNFSWKVAYDSNNSAQRDIPASCPSSSMRHAWSTFGSLRTDATSPGLRLQTMSRL
jgi:hypothetical protein